MAHTEHLPPQPRQAQVSSVLAAIEITLLAAGLVTGIVLASGPWTRASSPARRPGSSRC